MTLMLPSGASTSSPNPVLVGDMTCGTATATATRSWTVVFTQGGMYTLTVQASGYDTNNVFQTVSDSKAIVVTTVTTTTTPTITTTRDFKIDVTPRSSSVRMGDTATFTVTVSSIGGFSSDVYIEVSGSPALPPGSYFATPNPVKPPADDSQRATLTVNTKNFDSAGTYLLTISGRSGATVRTTVAQLEVKAVSISVTVSPGSQVVEQGQSTQFTVNVEVGDYKGTVSIAVTGIPAGATHTINPSTLTGSGMATLTITTSDQTPVGTQSIQVSATGGGGKAHDQVFLTVKLPWWKEPWFLALILILGAALVAIVALLARRKPTPPPPTLRPTAVSYPTMMRPPYPGPAPVGVAGAAICFGCGSTIPAGYTTCPRCGKPK